MGLEILDLSDLSSPCIVGHLTFTGEPVEMMVADGYAYLVVRDTRGYLSNIEDLRPSHYRASAIMTTITIGAPTTSSPSRMAAMICPPTVTST